MSTYRLNPSIISNALRTGRLDLHGLSLTQLPQGLLLNTELAAVLTQLDLADNHLTTLPSEIGHFTSLRRLALDGNSISTLPYELALLPHLKTLSLDGNPLNDKLKEAYRRARQLPSGRDASPVLTALLEVEEREVMEAERALCEDEARAVLQSEEVQSLDSRLKQASLQSQVFASLPLAAEVSIGIGSKKHSEQSHFPSTIFTAANDVITQYHSKRILSNTQSAQSVNAPFGTDDQAPEQYKERRLPLADVNEKENDFSSLHGLGGNEQNRVVVNAGKRMMKTESRPSPFGTIDGKFDSLSSNQQSQRNMHEARKAIDEIIHEPQSTKLAAGRSDSRGSGMTDLMSHRAINEPGSYNQVNDDHHGVRIVKQTPSDIFHTSRPSSPVHAPRSVQQRSTAPWATESDAPKAQAQSRYHHQTSNVFNSTAEVARTGRARLQPKQDSGIF